MGPITKKYLFSQEVLLVYKNSRLHFAKESNTKEYWQKLYDNDDNFIKKMRKSHDANIKSIDIATKLLDYNNIKYNSILRSDLYKHDLDKKLIITLGGDGTFLDVAHRCHTSVILGVNSDPEESVGALCSVDINNFEQALKDTIHDKSYYIEIYPIEIYINNIKKDIIAINDILFCHENPGAISRYEILANNHQSEQKSSGLWISTALGSSGAIFSAGGIMQVLDDRRLQFIVREPYMVNNFCPEILHGFSLPGDSLSIKPTMNNSAIYIDGSHHKEHLPMGAILDIRLSANPLRILFGKNLDEKREKIINNRKKYRSSKI